MGRSCCNSQHVNILNSLRSANVVYCWTKWGRHRVDRKVEIVVTKGYGGVPPHSGLRSRNIHIWCGTKNSRNGIISPFGIMPGPRLVPNFGA